jgi:hypothetical protein
MTLELIAFIAAILFGVFLYWRESKGNRLYRFLNKIINSKALQMQPDDKTGFVYQQTFLIRLVSIGFLFLVAIVVFRFLIPINVATVSMFASMMVGTLLGTYLANFILKSSKVIDKKSDIIESALEDTLEKGKDFIEDLKSKEEQQEEPPKEIPKVKEKSARERLKDKGYLK